MERRIFVTRQDLARLQALIEGVAASRNVEAAEALESELAQAQVVEPGQIPPDVVTMHSRVRFQDESNGNVREVTLVFPHEAEASQGRVSVLAPVGAAILGLRQGDSVEWPMPNGKNKTLRIVDVTYQPEAAGDAHL